MMKRSWTIRNKKKRERPRNIRKKKQTEISCEESLLQILRQKKMDDTDVDEDKCLLVSLLPPCGQFNDERKFPAPMEILENMRHVKLQQYLDRHSSCSLPAFPNASSFLPNPSHLATNPQNPQPVTSMQNSEILSRYLSNYSVQPQTHQLPQLSSSVTRQ